MNDIPHAALPPEPVRGLAGVPVDTTAISEIDGARGELRYRGYPIEQLVERDFRDVVALVLDGELPDVRGRLALAQALEARLLPQPVIALLQALPRDTHAMTVLQIALPLLDDATAKQAPVLSARAPQRAWIKDWCSPSKAICTMPSALCWTPVPSRCNV